MNFNIYSCIYCHLLVLSYPSSKDNSVEDIFREARAKAPNQVPFKKEREGKTRTRAAEDLVPLSWTDQVAKPNIKVLGLCEASSPPARAVS